MEEMIDDADDGELPKEEKVVRPPSPIRSGTEVYYDLQKLRISLNNRLVETGKTVLLRQEDKDHLTKLRLKIDDLEKEALKHVTQACAAHPFNAWLKAQPGVGPTTAAVILSSIDIHKADTVSKIWAYAGLDVTPNGQGRRRVAGQKLTYNPWLKTKLVGVLADCFMRMAVWDEASNGYVKKVKGEIIKHYELDTVWRRFYDSYRHRKESQCVPKCMACNGTGVASFKDSKAGAKCENCDGKGGQCPWGKSDAHRDRAAKRYMIKSFLIEMHKAWRELEGLPVRPPYAEEKLGMKHNDGGAWYRGSNP